MADVIHIYVKWNAGPHGGWRTTSPEYPNEEVLFSGSGRAAAWHFANRFGGTIKKMDNHGGGHFVAYKAKPHLQHA